MPEMRFGVVSRVLNAVGLSGLAMRVAQNQHAYRAARHVVEKHMPFINGFRSGNYLNASKTNRVTADWGKAAADGRTIVSADATTARQRARWLVINNPYAAAAKTAIVDNTIGVGVVTQCRVQWSKDPNQNERQNTKMEDRKRRWMEQADAQGRMHWYEMQRLCLGGVTESGEAILRRRFLDTPGRVLPLAYEAIEVSQLTSMGTTGVEKGNEIKDGVEISADGVPVAMHFAVGEFRHKTARVPMSQIVHAYRVDWPGQHRGLTWFAPVIPSLYMLSDIIEYATIARKVQSAISVIVSQGSNGGIPAPMPGLNAASGDSATNEAGDVLRWLEPGGIHRVGQGNVTAFTPASSNDLDPLTKLILRGVAIGMGISYEWVSGDFREVSYASGRLSKQDAQKHIMPIHGWYTRRIESPVHRDWVDAERAFGELGRFPAKADPYAVRYGQPRWGWGVNPSQEVTAALKAVNGGISTIRDEIESRGGDWQEFLKQMAEEIDFADALGLRLYPDLRKDEGDTEEQS